MANINAVSQIYEGLVELDDSLNLVPKLAKRWSVSPDGLDYTFILRNDVYFHPHPDFGPSKTRALNANDVRYSFERLLDPELGAKGAWVFRDKVRDSLPFETLNDSTFVIHLKQAYRPLIGLLSTPFCYVVPADLAQKLGKNFRTQPIGTGPFYLKVWEEGQTLILSYHDAYRMRHENHPVGIRFYFIKDRQTAFFEFKKGKLHLLTGLESSYTDELLDKQGTLLPNSPYTFVKQPFLNTEYLGILMDFKQDPQSPLAQKKVRQALNWAIDKDLMLKTLRNNVGIPAAHGFIPLGMPGYDQQSVKGYTYNPEKAKTLLAEAGFPKGKNLPVIVLHTNADYADLCAFIMKQWERIGVKSSMEVLDPGTLRSLRDKQQLAMFRASWIADYPDPENYFALFYGKNASPPNYFKFKHDTFDALYERALRSIDEKERNDLYVQMDQILVDEAPVIFLFYDQSALFAQQNIKGVKLNPMNNLDLSHGALVIE
jgi:peptide/nickel transport system substrate-binding protein